MVVNRTVAIFTLVGGTPQTFLWPTIVEGSGSNNEQLVLRSLWGSIKVTNTTTFFTAKFQYGNANDVVATASVFDIAGGIVAATNNDETMFAIPPGSIGISIFASAAITSGILATGGPE